MSGGLDAYNNWSAILRFSRGAKAYNGLGWEVLNSLPAFLVLVTENYTIRFTNEYFIRQFGKADTCNTCYSLMCKLSSPCHQCLVQQVFKEGIEQVWIWDDVLRGLLYEVHGYPYKNEKGERMVLGLGVDIDRRQKQGVSFEKDKSDQENLRICCHCKNVRYENGSWEEIEVYLGEKHKERSSHGICPDCLVRYYPKAAKLMGLL